MKTAILIGLLLTAAALAAVGVWKPRLRTGPNSRERLRETVVVKKGR